VIAGRDGLITTAGLVLVGDVVTRGLGFLFLLLLAHVLDKPSFALVYFVISTGFFAAEPVLTGYPPALTHFLALHRESRAGWATSAVVGGLPLLLLSMVLGEIFAHLGDAPAGLMSVVVIGLSIDYYYFAALQGLRRFQLLPVYRGSANLVQLLLVLLAVQLGIISVAVAVTIYSLVYIVPIIALEAHYGFVRRLLHEEARPQWEKLKRLTRFAAPALVSGMAYATIFNLDSFFVRLFAPHALADYGAARTLVQPMVLIPTAIGVILFPQVTGVTAARQWQLLKRGLTVVGIAGGVAVAGYLLFGPLAVDLLFPPSYRTAVTPLRLLAVAVAILGCYIILSQWWLGRGRPSMPAVSLAIGAVICVGCLAVLTRRYGSTGAALSITCGIVIATLILGIITGRRARRWRQDSSED
jgi:stage V sporulation protein B